MNDPVLSVVVPVYNRADIVGRALRSIADSARAAGLARDVVEVVVVDDGSADGSAAAARAVADAVSDQATVRVFSQANAGPAAARNFGVSVARAPNIAFLDSDDVWLDATVAALFRSLRERPDAALVFLKPAVFSATKPLAPVRGRGVDLKVHDGFISAVIAHAARSFGTNNVMMPRQAFERLGGFATEFRCYEDTDLFLRADPEGPCVVLDGDDTLGRQRGRNDNLTGNWAYILDGYRRMKRKEAAGGYPRGAYGDPRRVRFLAGPAVRAAQLSFASGRPGLAYAILFRDLGLIVRGGMARWAWRLPLTPVLTLLRPKNYPFRLRPSAARA